MQPGGPREVRGAEVWAKQAVVFAKGARWSRAALVDGVPGVLLAPHGRLMRALRFTFSGDRIAAIEVIGDAEKLGEMELGLIGE
jgi:RNA polymerase sigma-70 factor (ECF subfamily)